MNRKMKIVKGWGPVLAWMTVIFMFSAQPATISGAMSGSITAWVIGVLEKMHFGEFLSISTLHMLVRKMAHFTIYLVLGGLTQRAFVIIEGKPAKFQWPFIICALYAMSDEFHQQFVPGRGPHIKDVVIDSIGALTGIYIYTIIILKKVKEHGTREKNESHKI